MQLSLEQLKQAIAIREQVEALETKLSALWGGTSQVEVAPPQKKGMSAFGRARVAAAQKTRWAKKKQTTKVGALGSAPAQPKVKTKTMSPEARARIGAAQKARWAKKKRTTKAAAAAATPGQPKKKTKTMSPEARARIASSQKARWAKIRAGKKG